jgi:hypothetical protein
VLDGLHEVGVGSSVGRCITDGIHGHFPRLHEGGARICEDGRCVAPQPSSSIPRGVSSVDVAPAAARRIPLTEAQSSRLASVAGPLEAVRSTTFSYRAGESEVRLNGRVIVKPSESEWMGGRQNPSFAELFENAAGYDQVVVIGWDGMGNACSGYGYTFVGLRKDGTHAVQEQGYCGGPPPQITLYNKGEGILFATPDSPPNRGTGIIKGAKSVFANGTLRNL